MFTQYGLGLLILGLDLAFVVQLVRYPEKALLLKGWIISQILILGAVVLVYQVALSRQLVLGGFGATATADYLASGYWDGSPSALPRFVWSNTVAFLDFAYPSGLLLLFLVCLGLVNATIKGNGARTALLMFVLPMFVTFFAACARLYPYLGGRQDIFLTPMTFVMAALGFDYVLEFDRKRVVALVLVLLFGLKGIYSAFDYLARSGIEDIRPVASAVSSSFEPPDRIYIYYGAIPAFTYYYRAHVDRWIYGITSRAQPDRYLQQLDGFLNQPGRIWMVFSHCYSNECESIAEYTARFRPVQQMIADEDVQLYLAR